MEKKKPTSEVRIGKITGAIWENQSEKGTFYNVTFSRLYRDGKDWKKSDSFGRDDLLLLAKVADLAHTTIYDLNKPSESTSEEE